MGAGDMEQRITAIEEELVTLRRDTAAARALAAGADRDVADVAAESRANARVLHALRVTQLEHGEAITELRADVTELRADVTELRAGLGRVEVGMGQIVRMLESMGPEQG